MKRNYHTHTTRCLHASGSDEDYVLGAIEAGFETLGFADHAPWQYQSGYVSTIRMPHEQWADYRASVLALKERFAGRFYFCLGRESEFFPRFLVLLHRWRDEGCEYFILGQHFVSSEEDNPYIGKECATDDGLRRYADSTAEAIATGLFSCVAHPDLYMRPRQGFDKACMEAADAICQAAKEHRIPIEYNLLGLLSQMNGRSRGYPDADFWQYVRKWDNAVILGVDAHDPSYLTNLSLWEAGVDHLTALDYRIIDHI